MKKAFVTCAAGHLASAIVPNRQENALRLGARIVATRPLDLGYAAQIETGEMGTVDYIDPDTGMVEILLDVWHRGLDRWDNHMWLEPFGTEDIEGGVSLHKASVSLCA